MRRIDLQTGEVLESLELSPGATVTGLESDGGERFFCGGGGSGKLRIIRRPKHDPGASGDPADAQKNSASR